MSSAGDLLLELRRRGVQVDAVDEHLRLDAPTGILTPQVLERVAAAKTHLLRMLADESRRLDLPLSRFAEEGTPLETHVPWWDETIWFVPGAGDVQVLLEAGVGRGRIWTAAELLQIAALDGLADPELQSLATIKTAFGCTVLEAVALGPDPPPACRACRETSFWTRADGRQICARCHPQTNRPSPDDPGDGRPR